MAEALKTHACADGVFYGVNTGVLGLSPRLASPTQNKRIPDADNHTCGPDRDVVPSACRCDDGRWGSRCYLSCSHPYNVGS